MTESFWSCQRVFAIKLIYLWATISVLSFFFWCSGQVSACGSSCNGWRVPSLLKAAQLHSFSSLPAPHYWGKRWGLKSAMLVEQVPFTAEIKLFIFCCTLGMCILYHRCSNSKNLKRKEPVARLNWFQKCHVCSFVSCYSEVGNLKFHRYSQEKTLRWLKKKVLMPAVSPILHIVLCCFPAVLELCVFRLKGLWLHSKRGASLSGMESSLQPTSEQRRSRTTTRVGEMPTGLFVLQVHYWPVDGSDSA